LFVSYGENVDSAVSGAHCLEPRRVPVVRHAVADQHQNAPGVRSVSDREHPLSNDPESTGEKPNVRIEP